MEWRSARDYCKSEFDATLVVINDMQENGFLQNEMYVKSIDAIHMCFLLATWSKNQVLVVASRISNYFHYSLYRLLPRI